MFHLNQSEAEYRAMAAVAHSDLKLMDRSPAAYRERVVGPPVEPTPQMIRGRALHHLILETRVPFSDVYVEKDWDGRTKEGKARAAEVEAKGLSVLSKDDMNAVQRAAQSFHGNKRASALFLGAPPIQREASVTWPFDKDARHACKGRIDGYGNGVLWDLKWSADAHPSRAARGLLNGCWHTQLAWYGDGLGCSGVNIGDYVIVAIEAEAPYETYVYRVDEEAISRGREVNDQRMRRLIACQLSGRWPGGPDEVIDLSLPKWAITKEE